MSEGIIMVDESGKIILSNPVAEILFGYGKNELNGLTMECLLPERYQGHHSHLRAGFNAHPEPRRMGVGRDLTALRKDGSEFPVEISLSYTRLQDQLLIMAFVSDISQRKKSEEALKRSEEQLIVYAAELEKKVQMRTEALNSSIQELEDEVKERKKAEEEAHKALEKERELNELKSKFVSIASHEFRTPLSTILSSTSLINQYNDLGDPDKVKKHVLRIKNSVNHLTSILNDFLSLGKLEEGKIDLQVDYFSPREFLDEVKEELKSILKSGQNIHIECQATSSMVYSDTRILRNIFFNLVSNASKYSGAEQNIYLSCSHDKKNISFKIRDEGIGIPFSDQKHMFERFFRASNADQIQGTGLGLNIVKRYTELLRGTITFTSECGKGTTFILEIPIE
ncbi:MAG: PAS domain S-box protein [Cyclobacteriaceae bacterium]|nr:PAS domain S-box protein [Cyclobacteriaceae bacterium]